VQFDALFAYAKEHGKKAGWKYIELRGGTTFLPGAAPSISYLGHTLDLTVGELTLFSGLRDSTRRNIRKAEKEGVEVTVFDTMDAMAAFCELNQITRKQHGLPPQPFSFFSAVHDHVVSKGFGFVSLASYQGRHVAGAVFFHFGRKALYKYGASAPEHQQVRANNLAMWKAIERLSKRGFESLCFGRTDMGHDGLRQFKAGWAAQEDTINYYRYDLRENKFVAHQPPLNGISKKIFGKLPVPVLNVIGSLAYRHMG
jgi:lipid II:glycine glycyltransferase (peptidoglycan interpeptide bridge formation enzyme)